MTNPFFEAAVEGFTPSPGNSRSGSEKWVFWKRGLFRKVHFLETLENLEILVILEKPQTVENKGESDHVLEILENLEILEILEVSSSEKTPFVMTPFSGPDSWKFKSLKGTGNRRILRIFAEDRRLLQKIAGRKPRIDQKYPQYCWEFHDQL